MIISKLEVTVEWRWLFRCAQLFQRGIQSSLGYIPQNQRVPKTTLWRWGREESGLHILRKPRMHSDGAGSFGQASRGQSPRSDQNPGLLLLKQVSSATPLSSFYCFVPLSFLFSTKSELLCLIKWNVPSYSGRWSLKLKS